MIDALLDTSALLALADGSPRLLPSLRVVRQIRIPTLVLGEFHTVAQDSEHRDAYEGWLAQVATAETLLTPDAETARRYAALRRELHRFGQAMPWNDYWIAALALQHGLTLISESRHFEHAKGIQRIHW